jgi:hypothetical protein
MSILSKTAAVGRVDWAKKRAIQVANDGSEG